MPQPKPKPISLANLQDFSAPDKPGETISTTVRLRKADYHWLSDLPEGKGYHVRQAIQMYRKQVEA
jgi:hypothetical protein